MREVVTSGYNTTQQVDVLTGLVAVASTIQAQSFLRVAGDATTTVQKV